MERHKERRRSISQVIFLLMPLATCLLSAANVEAAPKITGCTGFCHGMPPKDGQRKGNPHFDSISSTVRGNHQTHLRANPTANSCTACHGTFAAYTSVRHQNNIIEMSANIHTSPSAATYSRGTFFNQTSIPPLGSCFNVNCHFTASTDVWGTTPAYSTTGANTTTCGKCHGAPPTTNNHAKHFTEFGATISTCQKCHPDHAAESAKFQHATSAASGGRNLSITFAGAPNGAGSYTGSTRLAYPSYLAPGGTFGSCSATYCHSVVTQTWGGGPIACGSCHPANSTLAGKHSTHYQSAAVGDKTGANASTTTAYIYECGACHFHAPHADGPVNASQTAQIFFNSTTAGAGSYVPGATSAADAASNFNYTNGTCTNTYCHSNGAGNPGNNASFTWTSAPGTLGCNGCHNYTTAIGPAMATGKHTKHTAGTVGNYSYSCAKCHLATTTDGATIIDKSKHVNKTKDVAIEFNGFLRTTWWNGSQCVNTYCHGDGTSFSIPPASTVAWSDGPRTCSSCHTGGTATGPTYANGSPKANSHNKHVVTLGYTCNNCHNSVTTTGTSITDVTKHVNQAYDLQQGGTGVTFTATAGTSSTPSICNNISCHGGAGTTATWGATLNCQNCHTISGSVDVDNFALPFTTASPVAKLRIDGEWDTTGHGKVSGTYASGNNAANFGNGNPSDPTFKQCEYCHDSSILHNDGTNPFRLRNINDATWGINGVCMSCHAASSAGVTVGGIVRNAARKVSAYHKGSNHLIGFLGGQFCWDCHDGHGDNNAYMIHKTVAKNSVVETGAPIPAMPSPIKNDPVFTLSSPPVGTDYVKPGPAFNGICQVCHGGTSYYNDSTYDTRHNLNTRCTICHTHNGDAPTTNNKAFSFTRHSYPAYYGHKTDSGASPFPSCVTTGCHANTKSTGYPLFPGQPNPAQNNLGNPPDCQGCHTKAAPGIGCGSCHGGADGRPTGSTFPDVRGGHNADSAHLVACSTCHGTAGSPQTNHGPGNGSAHTAADVILVPATGWNPATNTCTITCGGTTHGSGEVW